MRSLIKVSVLTALGVAVLLTSSTDSWGQDCSKIVSAQELIECLKSLREQVRLLTTARLDPRIRPITSTDLTRITDSEDVLFCALISDGLRG